MELHGVGVGERLLAGTADDDEPPFEINLVHQKIAIFASDANVIIFIEYDK
jgi:hypothetical protein